MTKHSITMNTKEMKECECMECGSLLGWKPGSNNDNITWVAFCCTGEYIVTPTKVRMNVELGLYDPEDFTLDNRYTLSPELEEMVLRGSSVPLEEDD